MTIEISTLQQLQDINNNLTEDYILTADIDASATSTWNGGEGFLPIADNSLGGYFTGTLDGNGHTITGLTINRPSTSYQALIANAEGATIKNLTLANVDITAYGNVAGIVAYGADNNIIDNCHVTGNVAAGGDDCGGIAAYYYNGTIKNCTADVTLDCSAGAGNAGIVVGYPYSCTVTKCDAHGTIIEGGWGSGGCVGRPCGNANIERCMSDVSVSGPTGGTTSLGGFTGYVESNVTIKDCYCTGNVSNIDGDETGGFVGTLYQGTVERCYSTGVVDCSGSSVGGFCGNNDGGTITECYWDTETSGMSTSNGGDGLTTVELKDESNFYGWIVTGYWIFDSAVNNGYPSLIYAQTIYIETLQQLQDMKNDLISNYILVADIDASDTSTWNSGDGFEPIGTEAEPFQGSFTAAGHTISNLYISRGATDYVGLFGYLSEDAEIDNVILTGVDIEGDGHVGGLAGQSLGAISNIQVSGTLHGNNGRTGGIAGRTTGPITSCTADVTLSVNGASCGGIVGAVGSIDAMITDCEASVDITTGADKIGGIAGEGEPDAIISDCKANGTISLSGSAYAGGIAGRTYTEIINCESRVNITAFSDAGGVVGFARNSIIRCSASGNISGSGDRIGGLVGQSLGAISNIQECFATGNVVGLYEVGGLVGALRYGAAVSDCYATGSVEATRTSDTSSVGGLVGSILFASVTRCYSTGVVTYVSSTDVGGLIGNNGGTITECYWDTETSGMSTSNGGTGKTTCEMKDPRTFAAWDTIYTWRLLSHINNGYPCLVTVEYVSTYKIEGTVYDSGEPVENAVVYIVDPATAEIIEICKTGADGKWAADHLQNKEYLVVTDPYTETGSTLYKTATCYPAIQSIANN